MSVKGKNIIVMASAAREGGALSILRQFLSHLVDYVQDDSYYVFVDANVDLPSIPGVMYIKNGLNNWFHRLWMDYFGLKRWTHKNRIKPDLLISFQNTAPSIRCKTVVYYHQALVFYKRPWNFFSKDERLMFLYRHFYPLFVKASIDPDDIVVVQQPHIKKWFCDLFKHPLDNVVVCFPDVATIDVDKVQPYDFKDKNIHFIYPAIAASYKEHQTIIKAMGLMDKEKLAHVRIHFTITKDDSPSLTKLIMESGLSDYVVFEGKLPYTKLLSMYKSVNGLLFPSTIETLGLPLMEAASFGLPILVSDMDFSRETLVGYEGASFVLPYSINSWASAMEVLASDFKRYKSISCESRGDWPKFFNIIKDLCGREC